MQFTKCEGPAVPPDSALAVRMTEGGFHGYEEAIISHETYWQRRLAKSQEEVRLGHFDVAAEMVRQFEASEQIIGDLAYLKANDRLQSDRQKTAAEALRQQLIAALALSTLHRAIARIPDMTPTGVSVLDEIMMDGKAYGFANFLPEVAGTDDKGLPFGDHCIHVDRHFIADMLSPPLPESTPKEGMWYLGGSKKLYLRCHAPAVQTENMLAAQESFRLDLGALVTLTPFMAPATND